MFDQQRYDAPLSIHPSSGPSQIMRSEEFYSVITSSITDTNEADIPKGEEISQQRIVQSLSLTSKDACDGWIACFIAFFDTFFLHGVMNIYSLFLSELQKEFSCSLSEAAWLGSTTLGCRMLCGPLASYLVLSFSNRSSMVFGSLLCGCAFLVSSYVKEFYVLFATLCVPLALGTASVITPLNVIPVEYFKKYTSLTTGIITSGGSVGTLILAPLTQKALAEFGWRIVFRALAAFYFGLIILNCGIRPRKRPPQKSDSKKAGRRGCMDDLKVWNDRVFIIWVAVMSIVYFGYYAPAIYLASYVESVGASPQDASYIFMVMGGVTTISRLFTGTMMRCDLLSKLHVKQVVFVLLGTVYLLMAHVTTLLGIYIFAVVRGLLDGVHSVMVPTLTASLVGGKRAILGLGHLAGAISITYTFGPLTAGKLLEATGSFSAVFIMSGLPLIVSALLLFLLPWAQKSGREKRIRQQLMKIKEMINADKISMLEYGDGFLIDPEKIPLIFPEDTDDHFGSIHDFIQHKVTIMEASTVVNLDTIKSAAESILTDKIKSGMGVSAANSEPQKTPDNISETEILPKRRHSDSYLDNIRKSTILDEVKDDYETRSQIQAPYITKAWKSKTEAGELKDEHMLLLFLARQQKLAAITPGQRGSFVKNEL